MNGIILKQRQFQLIIWIVIIVFYSCNNNRNRVETTGIAFEWEDMTILFPEDVPCYVSGKDTLSELCDEMFRKEFKILLYVDSAGCSDCRLTLI